MKKLQIHLNGFLPATIINRKLMWIVILFVTAKGLNGQDCFISDSVEIEEVTVLALKKYQNMQAGTTIIPIDSLVLNSKISGSLADILLQNSALLVKSYGSGSMATVSMRGTGSSHTSLMWNGMPLNSPMTGQADFSLMPVYFIDEANILMGSASLLNVGGALGGSISIENKPEWDRQWKWKLMQGYGSFKTYSSFGCGGWSNKKSSFRSRFFYENSVNNFKYYNTERNVGFHHQFNNQYQRGGILNEGYFRLSQESVLSIKYWFQAKEYQIPKLLTNSASDHHEKQKDFNHRFVTNWQKYGHSWNWNISAGYSNDLTTYELQNTINGSTEVISNYDAENLTHIFFSQAMVQFKRNDELTFSFQLSDQFSKAIISDYIKNIKNPSHQNEFSALAAAYKKMGNRWFFSFLIRQHFIDNQMVKPVPSLGTEVSLFNNDKLKFKFNLARNYHHPSLNDKYYEPGGNPDLKPEEGITGEMGLISTLGMLKTSVNFYYSQIHHWILWEPSQFGYWIPRNVQTVHSRGMETSVNLSKNWENWILQVSSKYALTLTTNESKNIDEDDNRKGKQLIYIPKHTANCLVHLTYRSYQVSWVYYYVGFRFTDTSNDPESFPLNAYQINNLSVGKQIIKETYQIGIHLKLDNVFNATYQNMIDRPMPLQSFSVLLKIDF